MNRTTPIYIAFDGSHRLTVGTLLQVATVMKRHYEINPDAGVLVFDVHTSESIDFNCDAVIVRAHSHPEPTTAPGPGRPKLGVVAREVTLLPRHWEWLKNQPGGASVALRKLVEQARRDNASVDEIRESQASTYRFMSAVAGQFVGFEEATRSLFAADLDRFNRFVAAWPVDIRDHLRQLSAVAFQHKVEPKTQQVNPQNKKQANHV
jgi:uncharacterized protein